MVSLSTVGVAELVPDAVSRVEVMRKKKRELNEVRARDAHGARTHGARPVRVACGARVSAVPKVLSQLKTQPIWM